MKSMHSRNCCRILWSQASPPLSSLRSSHTSIPAARSASAMRIAAASSSEAWLRKTALDSCDNAIGPGAKSLEVALCDDDSVRPQRPRAINQISNLAEIPRRSAALDGLDRAETVG